MITLADFAVTGYAFFDGDNVVAKFKNGKTNGATYTYDGTTWEVTGFRNKKCRSLRRRL